MKKTDKIPQEIVAFQPGALEIQNSRLPLAIRLCVWVPVVVIILAIGWACLSQVDVIVQGHGRLVTNTPTIIMKPLERSVIKEINVSIGDIVKPNQVLITFDPTINNAEAERLKNELETLSAQFDRLQAEFKGADYPVNDKNQFRLWQLAIFKQRREYFKERINYFDASLKQIDASSKTRTDSLTKQRERLAAVMKIEDMFRSLEEKKASSLKELLQISITRMEMEASVDQLQNNLTELQHQYSSTLATRQSFIQEWQNSISEEMVKIERDLTSTHKDYEKIRQLIEYVYLRSPCEAVVHEIASFSPGSAVREAEALITLVPLTGKIELEAEIRPQDIGKIAVGSEARVKLSAYPFQKYGTLNGVVRHISENTLQREQQQPSAMESSSTYYRARITVSGKLDRVPSDFRLIPGMEAQSDIKTGRRRVIEYILYPLIKAFDETAREP